MTDPVPEGVSNSFLEAAVRFPVGEEVKHLLLSTEVETRRAAYFSPRKTQPSLYHDYVAAVESGEGARVLAVARSAHNFTRDPRVLAVFHHLEFWLKTPDNHGWVRWPEPAPHDPDHNRRVGWHDDGQGGMVVYAVVPSSERLQSSPWWRAPRLTLEGAGPYLAVVPLGVSDWSWWLYDGKGGCEPFEATRADLTAEGEAAVTALEKLYGLPALLVTHIDT